MKCSHMARQKQQFTPFEQREYSRGGVFSMLQEIDQQLYTER